MKKLNQRGFLAETIIVLFGVLFFTMLFFTSMKTSNEVVSGIAYNTRNDKLFTGNTTFSVRAGENTPVTSENRSSYCLPPNSQYKELVNKAAEDKRIKIKVTEKKYFAFQAPWTCRANVTVEEVK